MRSPTRTALLFAAILLPVSSYAQGVIVQSVSDLRFFGTLGTMAGIAARFGGGDMHNIQSTTSIAGHKLRVESGNSATIIDVDAGRLTTLDHKQKTYTSMTFAEMTAAMEQAARSAQQNAEKAKAEQAKPGQAKDPNAPKGEVNFKYNVAVDRPGERAKIAGYDAERVFLTITIEAEATPEGEKTQQVGSLVFLLDHWMSKDAPQAFALQDFQREYAKKVGQTFRPPMEALQAAFTSDPRIKTGFEASGKELAKVPGIALRSVTYVAAVPPGVAFDRSLVLNDASVAAQADNAKKDEKPKPGGFRGLMGAIKSAAEDASKKADDKNTQPPKQGTLMSLTDEVKSITSGAVPPDTFEVPAGYREIKLRGPSLE